MENYYHSSNSQLLGSYHINNVNIPLESLYSIFDAGFYTKTSLNNAKGTVCVSAFDHWVKIGIASGFSPNENYNEQSYLSNHPEIIPYIRGSNMKGSVNQIYNSGLEYWLYMGYTTGKYDNSSVYTTYKMMTTSVDYLTADVYGKTIFLGMTATITMGDILIGNSNKLSEIQLTLSGDSSAAVIYVQKIYLLQYSVLSTSTINASGFSDISILKNSAFVAALTIQNLSINPIIYLFNTANANAKLTLVYNNMLQQSNTIYFKLQGIAVCPIIDLTGTSSFTKIAIESVGATINIFDGISSGVISQLITELIITGNQSINATFKDGIKISNIVSNVPATLKFSDATVGFGNRGVKATFLSSGSGIYFTTNTLNNNNIAFVGVNNILGVTLAAIPIDPANNSFTNLDTIDITDAILTQKNVTLSNFSNQIGTLILSSTTAASKAISVTGSNNKLIVYLGSINNFKVPLNQTAGHIFQLTGVQTSLTYNITGISASTNSVNHEISVRNVNTLNIILASGMQSNSTITVSADNTINTLNVSGGSTQGKYTINPTTTNTNSFNTVNASSCLGSTRIIFDNTLKEAWGSSQFSNIIIGNNKNETMYGGKSADIFQTGNGGVTRAMGNGGGDNYYYYCTATDGRLEILDFNATSDIINFSNLNMTKNGIGLMINGDGQPVIGNSTTSIYSINSLEGTLNATNNVIQYTGDAIDPLNTDFQKIRLQSSATKDSVIPFVYLDLSDRKYVHIGLLKFAKDTNSGSSLTSIITLSTIVDINNITSKNIKYVSDVQNIYQLDCGKSLPIKIENFHPGNDGDTLKIENCQYNNYIWMEANSANIAIGHNQPVSSGNEVIIATIPSIVDPLTITQTNTRLIEYTGGSITNPTTDTFKNIKINPSSDKDGFIPILYKRIADQKTHVEMGLLCYKKDSDIPDDLIRAVSFDDCAEVNDFTQYNFAVIGNLYITSTSPTDN